LVINIDDDHGAKWAQELAASRPVVSYGIDTTPQSQQWLRALNLQKSPQGLSFDIQTPDGVWTLHSGLLGHFNVYNLLAVAAAWQAAGVTMPQVIQALAAAKTVPGRMEAFRAPGKPLVVVDYAHTPAALSAALRAVSEHRETSGVGRIICVFGCGGERDRGKRPQMAAAVAEAADMLIMTDDNPRSESPQAIVAEMLVGLPDGIEALVMHDRATAIAQAIAGANKHDVVLIAGKGHEDYQQVGQERRAFSDRLEVARCLGQEVLACSA
jgi:UDP-N-acetylmuramoyl-L-alanyl-D-glutamate--2,6-diaminopimelate ligase